jgi:hypothetical protein
VPSLWLIIPAHGRYDVSRVAFPQLAWALDALHERHGIAGHAVVVAADGNLDLAAEHGFTALRAANSPLGKKWNDGYEYACRNGADYVAPCGTDDWIDPDYLAQLPEANQIRASRESAVVNEDGTRLATIRIGYDGGDGIRIIPAGLLKACGYRPADDRKERAIDTSVWMTLKRTEQFSFVYSSDPLNIVEFKSPAVQLNSYGALVRGFPHAEQPDPWGVLRGRFPGVFVDAAEAMYANRRT